MRGLLLPIRGLGGETLGGPQAGAPSSGVGGDLRLGRRQRRAGHEPQARVPAADADRQLGRADAAPALGLEEPLDDPVLERVVAQDDEPAAGTEEVEGGGQAGLERFELLVDGDPQSLERRGSRDGSGAGCAGWAGATRSMRAASSSAVVIGCDPAGVDDRPGDARRLRLLAVAPEERGQLGGVEGGEQLRRPGRRGSGRSACRAGRRPGSRSRDRGRPAGSWTGRGRTGSRRRAPKPASGATVARSRKFAWRSTSRSPYRGRSRASTRAMAAGSASRPRRRPSGLAASRIRSVCPPPPRVVSM